LNGIGIKALDKNPNKLLVHGIHNLAYIAFANGENAAPNSDRAKSFPANTGARYLG
jgi:hypothetical protein